MDSFIGVSQSLPMTAYIKMIDVWMIFAMMYPFCVVTLYSVMEALKNKKTNTKTAALDCLDTRDLMNVRSMRTVPSFWIGVFPSLSLSSSSSSGHLESKTMSQSWTIVVNYFYVFYNQIVNLNQSLFPFVFHALEEMDTLCCFSQCKENGLWTSHLYLAYEV